MSRSCVLCLATFLVMTLTAATQADQVSFQGGVNGYTGSVDNQLSFGLPDNPNTDGLLHYVDAITVSQNQGTHALVRFDNIIGSGAGKIPAGSTVVSATLVLTTATALDGNAPGAGGTLNRMLQNWTDTDTWNTWGGDGIQANGIEAASTSNASVGAPNGNISGVRSIDVHVDVQAWVNGTANHGWAILPWSTGGTNGWAFFSDNNSDSNLRPSLSVTFTPPVPAPEPMTGLILFLGTGLLMRRGRSRSRVAGAVGQMS